MTEQVDDFLMHYGVPGMKWGKRKRQDSGGSDSASGSQVNKGEQRQAKREVKAQKFDSRASKLNTTIKDLDSQIKALPPGYRTAYKRAALEDIRNDTVISRDRAVKDAKAVREGKLTTTQKHVVIGASIVAGLAATYVIQDNIQSGNATRLIAKGKERMSGEKFNFNKKPSLADPNLDADGIQKLVVKHINPDYGAMGTKMNCRRATFSYEMRRRGYDVKATKTTNANGQNVLGLMNATSPGAKIQRTSTTNVMSKIFKETSEKLKDGTGTVKTPVSDLAANFAAGGKNRISAASDSKSIFDALGKEPNGSRGEIGVMWSMGGGHSMAYEVIKGKPVIFDAQSGKKFDAPEAFAKIMPKVKDAGFTRLDNVDLNVDYLMRWMTNA